MKRLILVLILFLTLGCSAACSIAQEINSRAKSANQFVSVSLTKAGESLIGRLWNKDGNMATETIIWLRGAQDVLHIDRQTTSWAYVEHTIYQLGEGIVRTTTISDDGKEDSSMARKKGEMFGHSSWEDSPRGLAIEPSKIRLESVGVFEIDGLTWRKYRGNYDLRSDLNNRLVREGRKGVLSLWHNLDEGNTIELYTNELGLNVVVRRIWLTKDAPDHAEFLRMNGNSMLREFYSYYDMARFNEFSH